MKDKEDIEIREIKKSDGKFILEIRNDDSTRFVLHNSDQYTLDQFNSWYENDSPYWLIASYRKLDFGYFRTCRTDSKDKIRIGMDIHPNFRGQGLARPSYLKLFDFLKNNNYKEVDLEVLEKNKIAHSLYLKLGFIETKKYVLENGLVSIVMRRDL